MDLYMKDTGKRKQTDRQVDTDRPSARHRQTGADTKRQARGQTSRHRPEEREVDRQEGTLPRAGSAHSLYCSGVQ